MAENVRKAAANAWGGRKASPLALEALSSQLCSSCTLVARHWTKAVNGIVH